MQRAHPGSRLDSGQARMTMLSHLLEIRSIRLIFGILKS